MQLPDMAREISGGKSIAEKCTKSQLNNCNIEMNDSLYKKSQISSRSELLGKGIQNGGLKGIFEMKMVIFKYHILNNSVGLRWIKFHNSQSSVLAYVVLIAIK